MAVSISLSNTNVTLSRGNNFKQHMVLTVSGAPANTAISVWLSLVGYGSDEVIDNWTEGKVTDSNGFYQKEFDLTVDNNTTGVDSLKPYFNDEGSTTLTLLGYCRVQEVAYRTQATVTLNASAIISDTTIKSDFPSDNNVFIRGITSVIVETTIVPQFDATLNSVNASFDGEHGESYIVSMTALGSNRYRAVLDGSSVPAGYLSIEIVAIDSRNQRSFKDTGVSIQSHSIPIVTHEIFRCDEYGVFNNAGRYLSVTVFASPRPPELELSALNVIGYDKDGNVVIDDGQGDAIDIISGQSYILGDGTIDPADSYIIEIIATDNAVIYGGTSQTANINVRVAPVKRIINFKKGGTGVAFGKLATENSLTDSAWDINTDGEYLVQGEPLMTTHTTTTIADIITAGSGITISSASYAQWGKVAQVDVVFSVGGAISIGANGDVSNFTVGFLVEGKRPAIAHYGVLGYGDANGCAIGQLTSAGAINVREFDATGTARTLAAGTSIRLAVTYILA